jgi:hypothetical protein
VTNASPLPDDIDDWPQNPYELLGVAPNASPDVIKRAYSSLIRRFKPDQFPAEFERIRAAYDAVNGSSGTGFIPTFPMTSRRSVPFNAAWPTMPTPRARRKAPAPPEAWKLVRAGDPKQAYLNLVAQNQANPSDEQVYVQLFWLCALFPQVAREKRPGQWLLAGLRQATSVTAITQLWEMELRQFPIDAIGDEILALITSNLRPQLTFELLRARWEAALIGPSHPVGTQHDTLVVSDVGAIRSSALGEETGLWIGVLSEAAERLAWSTLEGGRAHSKKFIDEIDRLIRQGTHWPLERLDLAVAAAEEWHRLQGTYGEWLRPICTAWLCSASEAEAVASRLLYALAADHDIGLRRLDYARQHAPVLLWRLDQFAVAAVGAASTDEEDTDAARRATINGYFRQTGTVAYADWRRPLLEFLVAECLQPIEVAAVIETMTSKNSSTRQAAWKLRHDVPLACLCRAHRLLWRTR